MSLLLLQEMIDTGAVNSNNLMDTIHNIIIDIRKARGPYAVETNEQLDLILLAGKEFLRRKLSSQR